jgi:hypothetical protein
MRPHIVLSGLLALAAAAAVSGAQAQAQAARSPACVAANDEVTRLRIGRSRSGAAARVDVPKAVATGAAAAAQCRGDDKFLLAYALARIDLSTDTKRGTPAARTALFNASVDDLETVKRHVLAGASDRYEVFDILGLIYYQTGQFDRSVASLSVPPALLGKMTPDSRQKTYFTLGMAQAQVGRPNQAAQAFDLAAKNGHPRAQATKFQMVGAPQALAK